jgi:hypothetical protein
MTVDAARKPAPATRAEAEALFMSVLGTMEALLHLIAAETTLVRKGRVVEAGRMAADKAELARRYVRDLQAVQARAAELRGLAPELAERVAQRHEGFRAELQINMTVLATAKAVAESLMQEIAETVARQDQPTVYGRSGSVPPTTARTARPVTLSRSL